MIDVFNLETLTQAVSMLASNNIPSKDGYYSLFVNPVALETFRIGVLTELFNYRARTLAEKLFEYELRRYGLKRRITIPTAVEIIRRVGEIL